MVWISGSRTERNLKVSFSRLSQSHLRFKFFALRSDDEGLLSCSALFRATSDSVASSATRALAFHAAVGDPITAQPLDDLPDMVRATILSLTRDYTVTYPDMAATARAEGFGDIAAWFESVGHRKKHFADRLQHAIAAGLTDAAK